jgi:hypothetical protein
MGFRRSIQCALMRAIIIEIIPSQAGACLTARTAEIPQVQATDASRWVILWVFLRGNNRRTVRIFASVWLRSTCRRNRDEHRGTEGLAHPRRREPKG